MVSSVLVCPPDVFQIEYEINPWMHMDIRVDSSLAKQQHNILVSLYTSLYTTVDAITPVKGLPDMVYAANFGFVIGKTFIRSNFRFPQRRQEALHAEHFFLSRGYEVVRIPEEIYFEGQGDMLYRDGVCYFGHGKRSSEAALPYLKRALKHPIVSFHVDDAYYYHLDTCFAPIGEDTVVINPLSFSDEDLKNMEKHFSTIVYTSKKDNQVLCCNMVEKNGKIIVGKGVSEKFLDDMTRCGKNVYEVPMSEFLKGGGSVKCLTLEYYGY